MWSGTLPRSYRRNQAKGTLEVFGNEIFGLIKKKTENDSVPGSSFASEPKKKIMQVILREDPSSKGVVRTPEDGHGVSSAESRPCVSTY